MDDDRAAGRSPAGRPPAGSRRDAPPAGGSAPPVRAPLFQAPQFLAPDFPPARPQRSEEPSKPEEPSRPAEPPGEREPPGGQDPRGPARSPSRADGVTEDPSQQTPPRKAAAKKAEPTKSPSRRAKAAKATAKEGPAGQIPAKKATPAKKAATAKKAKTAQKAEPVERAKPAKTAETAETATTPEPEQAPAARTPERAQLWTRIRTRPEYAPELLALAAVAEWGPQAREWARDIRDTYPAATAEGLARLATRQLTRLSAAAGMVGVTAGPTGAVLELAGVAWAEARLVLHLAAAYEHDPTDPERAVDLLVLTQIHPTAEAAREALAAATADTEPRTTATADTEPRAATTEETASAERLVSTLSTRSRGWGMRRLANRLLPGAGLLLAIAGTTASSHRLAARAAWHYRAVRAS